MLVITINAAARYKASKESVSLKLNSKILRTRNIMIIITIAVNSIDVLGLD